jgi:hypothetical protein
MHNYDTASEKINFQKVVNLVVMLLNGGQNLGQRHAEAGLAVRRDA